MPPYLGSLRCGPLGASLPEDVLVMPGNGSRGGRIPRPPIQSFKRLIQGDLLSPNIFNVAVDTVLWHWVGVGVEEEAIPDRFGW